MVALNRDRREKYATATAAGGTAARAAMRATPVGVVRAAAAAAQCFGVACRNQQKQAVFM